MMMPNALICTPGIWIGEGKITVTLVSQFLKFYTKWEIEEVKPGHYKAFQTIENVGTEEKLYNKYHFFNIKNGVFEVELENDLFGNVKGTGIIDMTTIAWEFKRKPINGFEVYELQENGDFLFHGEYVSSEQFGTKIEGLIWKKS